MKFFVLGLAVAATAFFAPPTVGGESTKEAQKESQDKRLEVNKKEPIVITSDRMEVDQKKNLITYSGRVVAVQGDIRLTSATLKAYFQPKMSQIEEVVAEGKVHVTFGSRVATAKKATFSGSYQTITLSGDAVVRQGKNEVTGSEIIFYMNEDRAVVLGGNQQRVKATIFPGKLKDVDQQKGTGE